MPGCVHECCFYVYSLDIVFQHFFTEVQLKSSAPNIPPCTLRVAKRHKHYPALHIREAKVEDNDDIVPIFKQCNQNLDKQYGMGKTVCAGLFISQHTAVLEIRSKWLMDKCPSITILGQTISALLGQFFMTW